MSTDPKEDCFRPPEIPTLVHCIHCNEEYDSYLIHYEVFNRNGEELGFWMCGTPGCDGAGFGFDIFPVDPDWIDPEGRLVLMHDDECEDDDECEWMEDEDTAIPLEDSVRKEPDPDLEDPKDGLNIPW